MKTTTFQHQFLIIGAILAGTGVIFGAFGAHLLKDILSEKLLHAYINSSRVSNVSRTCFPCIA